MTVAEKKFLINKENLSKYIKELETLITEYEADTKNNDKVKDLGHTAKALQIVEDNYADMTSKLVALMKKFNTLVDNVLNEIVEIDES